MIIGCAVLATFFNSFRVPFVLDDTTVTANPSITHLWPLSTVLFPPSEIYSAGRPLLNLSFALNYAVGGINPWGYHVVNVAIHFLAALTLFGAIRRTLLLPSLRPRFGDHASLLTLMVVLIWAVFPVHAATITYISQRAECLMGLFYLLTLYAFVRGVEASSARWLGAAIAACAAGMATKEVMVTAPLVVLLYDRQFVAGSFTAAWQRRRSFYIGLAMTWLILFALMATSGLGARGVGEGHNLSRLEYMRIESSAICHYLKLTVWPEPLVFDYGPQLAVPTGAKLILAVALLVALIIGSAVAFHRGKPIGFVGIVFFLLLAPSSSIIPVAGQPIAENRVYLPLAVIHAALVIAVFPLGRRRFQFFAVLIALGAGWLTVQRNIIFQNEVRLWQDTVAKRPRNVRAWVYLSVAQISAQQPAAAIATLRSALKLFPDNAEFHNNLAVFLAQTGQKPEAVEHFRAAVRLKPDYSSAYYNFGAMLYQANEFAGALECFRAVVHFEPRNYEACNYLGLTLLRLGRIPEATAQFEAALLLKPDFNDARANLNYSRSLKP